MIIRVSIAAFALATVLHTTAGAQAAEVAFDLRIERGKVQPNMRRIVVELGDDVILRLAADKKTILHLHGYDIEKVVEPGSRAVMSFKATATGRFAVSVHVPKRSGDHSHDPPLTHVEVHPR
jgi:hypothetical protein